MIHTENLTKDFVSRKETVHAVRGIDLDVAQGELVAILGPNGAGKTTTMRMLTTLLLPTAGSARVAGFDVVRESAQVRRRIGYVGQGNGAGHNQRALDELYSQGVTYGLSKADSRRRAGELLESLDLGRKSLTKVSELSGGQRRRLDVAMGLMHAPALLVLDEPSTGLDPQNRANLWEHITAMRTQFDITLVLTTHYLDEADSMAERVVVVDHGEVIADDTPDALKSNLAGDLLVVSTGSDGAAGLARIVEAWQGSSDVTVDPGTMTARVADGSTRVAELIRSADAAGIEVHGVQVRRPTLDDVFLALTGRSLRESDAVPEEVTA